MVTWSDTAVLSYIQAFLLAQQLYQALPSPIYVTFRFLMICTFRPNYTSFYVIKHTSESRVMVLVDITELNRCICCAFSVITSDWYVSASLWNSAVEYRSREITLGWSQSLWLHPYRRSPNVVRCVSATGREIKLNTTTFFPSRLSFTWRLCRYISRAGQGFEHIRSNRSFSAIIIHHFVTQGIKIQARASGFTLC